MKYSKVKKIMSIIIIALGAIALISEISSANKNYYIQSAGLVLLMLGLFLVNATIKSKTDHSTDQYFEEE